MLKKYLLMFVRRFYQPELTYIDKLFKEWVDGMVRWWIDIIFNGFIGYLALFCLTYLFPVLRTKVSFGDNLWQLPFTIILIGIVLWFLRETWKWFQSNRKIVPPNIKVYQGR